MSALQSLVMVITTYYRGTEGNASVPFINHSGIPGVITVRLFTPQEHFLAERLVRNADW
jgi:hypothetical protein